MPCELRTFLKRVIATLHLCFCFRQVDIGGTKILSYMQPAFTELSNNLMGLVWRHSCCDKNHFWKLHTSSSCVNTTVRFASRLLHVLIFRRRASLKTHFSPFIFEKDKKIPCSGNGTGEMDLEKGGLFNLVIGKRFY